MTLLAAVDWNQFFFALFSLVAIAFGAGVLFTNNIVRMAFYLTISLGATAGLFFLAGAEFVGAMQLMIYVGGTLVLLIFGVMLTAQDSFVSMQTKSSEWLMAFVVGASLLGLLLYVSLQVEDWRTPHPDRASVDVAASHQATPIGLAVTGGRVDKALQPNETLRNGMSGYLLPFEIVSVHLLVVLIGAAYLARTKKRITVAAAQRAAAVDRSRPKLLTLMLMGGVVGNVLLGVATILFRDKIRNLLMDFELVVDGPAIVVVGGLFFLSALLLLAVAAWQKWAVYAAVLSVVAQAIVIITGGGGILFGVLFFALIIAPVAVTIYLLCRGGDDSVFARME